MTSSIAQPLLDVEQPPAAPAPVCAPRAARCAGQRACRACAAWPPGRWTANAARRPGQQRQPVSVAGGGCVGNGTVVPASAGGVTGGCVCEAVSRGGNPSFSAGVNVLGLLLRAHRPRADLKKKMMLRGRSVPLRQYRAPSPVGIASFSRPLNQFFRRRRPRSFAPPTAFPAAAALDAAVAFALGLVLVLAGLCLTLWLTRSLGHSALNRTMASPARGTGDCAPGVRCVSAICAESRGWAFSGRAARRHSCSTPKGRFVPAVVPRKAVSPSAALRSSCAFTKADRKACSWRSAAMRAGGVRRRPASVGEWRRRRCATGSSGQHEFINPRRSLY